MAVLGRLLVSSAERLDLPDVLSLDSYNAGDWKGFLSGLVGTTTPYILTGFDIASPGSAIGTQSCSVNVAESVVFYPGSSAGPFFFGLPAGNALSAPLVPELRKNATNYVYLTLTTVDTTADTRAFWDPDQSGGTGGEFSQDVNTESVLSAQINVSTGSFPLNTIPVAIITVGPVVITAIEDARNMLFRLGSGGINPNPYNSFNWPSLPNSTYKREEPSIVMTSPSDPNPFQGADKNITNLKDWMDAVMTKLMELGGTRYWYEDSSSYSAINTFLDALAFDLHSKGQWQHSSSTPGLLTWTEDLHLQSTQDPRFYFLRNGNITLADEQVAYLDLVRSEDINTTNSAVQWTNNQNYVNTIGGVLNSFSNLSQGDWIKRAGDDNHLWLRVEQFYDSTSLGGSPTTPSNAKSVRLSGTYQGATAADVGVYDKGVYLSSDVVISNRNTEALQTAGGDFHWLAVRNDTVESVSNAVSTSLSGTITSATGTVATCTVTSHGLSTGDYITVTAPAGTAGTYIVDVIDTNTFTFETTSTSTGALTAFYAVITTAARSTTYGLLLESANHCFSSGDTVIIAGTTNFNGSYKVNVRSATTFNIAIGSAPVTETSGTATLAAITVRAESGPTTVIQGQIVDIDDEFANNLRSFLGMESISQTSPVYSIPSGYNTLYGTESYNSLSSDNVTARLGKLTGMMADKAQDKTVKYLCNATSAINTANGSAQELTFSPSATTLTILQPGSPGNATISLPSSSPGISLLVNQSAYVTINRNAATTPSIVIANTAAVPVGENTFVIASRLSDASVYLWNGSNVTGSTPLTPSGAGLIKVKYYDPVSTALPTGNPVVEDGSNVQAGDLVLFSALSSGTNNAVYMANGTGTNITGWTVQLVFGGIASPSGADTIIVQEGASFKDQIGRFNDTTWVFNNAVRYFNGTDYFEQDALATSTLTDATAGGTLFTVGYAGSEYMIIDFSISRGINKETGTMYVTSDGTNVSIAADSSYIGTSGVSFSGTITGGGTTLNILYTTTSTGSAATMKYMLRRWSNSPGGPGGPPTYSGFSGSTAAAGGPNHSIQYNNSGIIDGNSNFLIDTTNNVINMNGLKQSALSSGITMADNMSTPTALFSYSAASAPFTVIEYSVVRNGSYRTGRFLIANDTIVTSTSDDNVETAVTGVAFSSAIVSGNVVVRYTTTATGFSATFKYSNRSWS